MAVIQDGNIVNESALQCLWDYVAEDPILSKLVDADGLEAGDAAHRAEVLQRVRSGLATLISFHSSLSLQVNAGTRQVSCYGSVPAAAHGSQWVLLSV